MVINQENVKDKSDKVMQNESKQNKDIYTHTHTHIERESEKPIQSNR